MIGQTFGRLTVVSYAYSSAGAHWHCACACGMPHVASTTNLRTGRVKSCGCLRRRAPLTVAEQRERLEVDIARLQKKLAELSEMDEAPQ